LTCLILDLFGFGNQWLVIFNLFLLVNIFHKNVVIFKSYDKKADSTEVRAPLMKFSIDFPIKLTAGFHFCKVLSPARALEWLYVDSLKP
jgi:hypothetical protein